MDTPLEQARYMSFATFRKNGQAVATPVWFAPEGDWIYLLSSGDAGKVKRLRNSPQAQLAPCTVTGKRLGPWQDSEAFLLDDPQAIRTAWQALRRRYGWQMWMLDAGAWLGGRIRQRAWISVRRPAAGKPASRR